MKKYKNLGSEFFPKMDADAFIDLLGQIALYGVEEAARTLDRNNSPEFPAAFLRLHEGKLQLKPFFLWTSMLMRFRHWGPHGFHSDFCLPVFYGIEAGFELCASGAAIRRAASGSTRRASSGRDASPKRRRFGQMLLPGLLEAARLMQPRAIGNPYSEREMARACLRLLRKTMKWCPRDDRITNCCPQYNPREEVADIMMNVVGMSASDFEKHYEEPP